MLTDYRNDCNEEKVIEEPLLNSISSHSRNRHLFSELGYKLFKEEKKYLAFCVLCNKTLKNTGSKRLIAHRHVCTQKPSNPQDCIEYDINGQKYGLPTSENKISSNSIEHSAETTLSPITSSKYSAFKIKFEFKKKLRNKSMIRPNCDNDLQTAEELINHRKDCKMEMLELERKKQTISDIDPALSSGILQTATSSPSFASNCFKLSKSNELNDTAEIAAKTSSSSTDFQSNQFYEVSGSRIPTTLGTSKSPVLVNAGRPRIADTKTRPVSDSTPPPSASSIYAKYSYKKKAPGPGRRDIYANLNFEFKKEGRKYSALCLFCKTLITNVATSRLMYHRDRCSINKPYESTLPKAPPTPSTPESMTAQERRRETYKKYRLKKKLKMQEQRARDAAILSGESAQPIEGEIKSTSTSVAENYTIPDDLLDLQPVKEEFVAEDYQLNDANALFPNNGQISEKMATSVSGTDVLSKASLDFIPVKEEFIADNYQINSVNSTFAHPEYPDDDPDDDTESEESTEDENKVFTVQQSFSPTVKKIQYMGKGTATPPLNLISPHAQKVKEEPFAVGSQQQDIYNVEFHSLHRFPIKDEIETMTGIRTEMPTVSNVENQHSYNVHISDLENIKEEFIAEDEPVFDINTNDQF